MHRFDQHTGHHFTARHVALRRRSLAAAATLAVALGATATATATSAVAAPSPDAKPQADANGSGRHTEIAHSRALQRALDGATTSTAARQQGPKDKDLQAQLDKLVANGAVAVAARVDGQSRDWAGASGVREHGENRKATKNDQFRAASNTKMMIATLVMQEVERGTWNLDSKANAIVPGLFPGHDITIEQLLSHLSGAPDALGDLVGTRMTDMESWPKFFRAIGAHYTDTEFIAMANSLPWLEPETKWSYSNAGYVALGVMLQKVTGSEIAPLLEKRVFAPAGMRHTSYPTKPDTNGPFLIGSGFTSAGVFSTKNFNPALFSSAGAVVSTTADLNRFTEALLNGKLVSKKSVEDMTTPRESGDLDYGLGLMRLTDPCTPKGSAPKYLYGHNGGAFGTVSWALSSSDGKRQVSLGITGRYYSDTDPAQPQPFDLQAALTALLRASC